VTDGVLCQVPRGEDVCGRQIRDAALLCAGCAGLLERVLSEVPSLVEDLETTRARLSRTGGRSIGGGHSSERPLPWSEHAAEASGLLRSTLVSWVRVVVDERGVTAPRNTLEAVAVFLLRHVEWLRHHPDAAEVVDEIRFAVREARQAVDRAPDRWYAGRCGHVDLEAQVEAIVMSGVPPIPCPEELYVREGADTVQCRTCSTEHNVERRRASLSRRIEDQLASARDLTTAVSNLVRPISMNTIRSWVLRKRLVEHGQTPEGVALYRVGDVLDLLAGDALRQSQRSSREAS
jgi:hypothetical protein